MRKNDTIDLSKKIHSAIADGKVKMRSKWFFVAEKLGLESGLVVFILLGIVLLCLMLYIMEENGVFEFTEFGLKSWPIILENIPYDLVIIAVVLFVIAIYIVKQFDFSYRKPFYIFSCGALVIVVLAGSFLTYSGVSRTLFSKLTNTELVKNVIGKKITKEPAGEKAVIGKIVKVESDKIYVFTADSKVTEVKFSPKIERPLDVKYNAGQLVKIIVEKSGQIFGIKFIKIVLPDQSHYFQSVPTPTATNYN